MDRRAGGGDVAGDRQRQIAAVEFDQLSVNLHAVTESQPQLTGRTAAASQIDARAREQVGVGGDGRPNDGHFLSTL